MPSLVSPDTLIALPGGGQVSAGFLAEKGVYQRAPGGQIIAPDDAYAVGMGGNYQVSKHRDWFPAAPSQDPAERAREIEAENRRRTQLQTNAQTSASVASILRSYGLEELIPQVDNFIRGGLSWPEIEAMLRDPSSDVGKVFDRMFPEIQQRTKAGLQPLSVEQIQSYRTQAKQMFRAAGLPEGFYDQPEDFSRFIVGDVSVQELEQRVMDGYVEVMNSPPEVRQELERLYGVGSGQLVAYFLDPERGLTTIQRQVASGKIAGASVRTGFGQLATSEAERVTALGVSDAEAEQGFGTLANARELTVALDAGEDAISRDEQLGAIFGGDAAAGERLSRRARRRQANFEGGGRLATSREGGFSGLSTAR